MRCLGTLFTQTQARGTTSFALFEVRMLATVQNSFSHSCFQILSKYLSMLVDFWLICFIIKQEDLEYQKSSAPVQSSLTFPGNSHVRITWGTCDAPRQVARTPAREELQAGPGAGEASDGKRHEGITHRIHGAGIYANIKGVYRWDPCYHIYNIAYSIHDLWFMINHYP